MGLLTFESFLAQLRIELDELTTPMDPPRRVGVDEYLHEQMSTIKSELLNVANNGEKKSLEYLEDYSVELMSLLYAAGSPHEIWRRWSSLVAFSQVLSNKHHTAALYAALGGEWAAIAEMPSSPVESADIENQII